MTTQIPNNKLTKIARVRLYDSVVEQMRHLIVEGSLAPGTKLNERELCDTFGISRTPLREALKVLATEGLVEITPNRGSSVSSITEKEMSELFEMMSGLESFSGLLACQRITPEELAKIEELHNDMINSYEKRDLYAYYECNRQIHDEINKAAGNTELRQIYLSINRRLQAMRFKSNLKSEKWQQAVQDHNLILKTLQERNGEKLSLILREHMLRKHTAVIDLINSKGS